ncbi:MAG: GNAT family N-acetyltransferase [Acidocella sp.]|uniref:GNAT family N-acetyltransferase n=1 Tax=Acidocella sp. TaxID=50710 RepID=UPI003FD86049
MRTTAPCFTTIFHEPWWLDAVTQGNWCEATVSSNGTAIARLPYIIKRRIGITGIGMPPLTHTLGPQLPLFGATSKFQQSDHRKLLKGLVAQLPRHDYFYQVFDPIIENALSLYELGYDSSLSYTLRIEATQSLERTWKGIRRQHRFEIKSAQKKFSIQHDLGIDQFCHFFNANLKADRKIWSTNAAEKHINQVKIRLYEACRAQDAGCLVAVRDEKNVLRAAIMLVWGHGVMYYFLATRDPDPASSGSMKLLIWEALKMASEKRLTFDFDSFPRPAAVPALASFGGEVRNRINITKIPPLLRFAHAIKSKTKLANVLSH